MSSSTTYKLIYEHDDHLFFLYFDDLNLAKKSFKELLKKDKYNPLGIYAEKEELIYLHTPLKDGKNVLVPSHKKLVFAHYLNTIKIKLKLPEEYEFKEVLTFSVSVSKS